MSFLADISALVVGKRLCTVVGRACGVLPDQLWLQIIFTTPRTRAVSVDVSLVSSPCGAGALATTQTHVVVLDGVAGGVSGSTATVQDADSVTGTG